MAKSREEEFDDDPPPRHPARKPEAQRRSRPDDDEGYAPEPRARQRPARPEPPRRRRDEDEDDEDDYYDVRKRDLGEKLVPTGNPKALIAYYCGIFGLIPLLGLILGPLALVFGILGKRQANRRRRAGGGGHAIAGIILGPIDFLLSLVEGIILIYMKSKGYLTWY
jgi:hypothetical protein